MLHAAVNTRLAQAAAARERTTRTGATILQHRSPKKKAKTRETTINTVSSASQLISPVARTSTQVGLALTPPPGK